MNQLAWRDGIFLALLNELGLVSSEPGKRTFGEGDRPLSGTLFELDPQQYQLTAAQLMQATAQAVPDVAKQLHSQLIGPFVDRKLADQYGKWLDDTFECGYVLCVSETWEGLDPDTLRSLIDEGLRRVIAEKDTRDPDLLINDPEYRIRNVSYGIMGDMPYFAQLGDYLATGLSSDRWLRPDDPCERVQRRRDQATACVQAAIAAVHVLHPRRKHRSP